MVLNNDYEVTAAQLRARCHNVNDVDWTDQALLDISAEVQADAHIRLKITTPYDEVTAANKFLAMKQIIKEGVAAEVLSGMDQYANDGKEARINYYTKIKQLKSGRMSIITGGPNLTDELDANNYTQEASETY